MARTREFDALAAVSAVEGIFWEKGYDGTSYADLTKATGLGKGSIYAAFGNKKSLYIKALENYIMREVEALGALILQKYENDPSQWRACLMDFFNVAIDAVQKRQDRRGCFLCNAAVDLAPYDKEVEATVMEALGKVKSALSVVLEHNVEEQKRDGIAEYILSIYLGMRVMAKAGTTPAQLTVVRDTTIASL
ncbi:MAG: TetR/AcrR family transcriptional regulator [Hyphomicrobiales bacterium]